MRVEANERERQAVAARLGLPEIRALSCAFRLLPAGPGRIEAWVGLRASVVQISVVSLEPFETEVAEDVSCIFVPAGTETDDIDPEAEDELPYEGDSLDLGEAATEQLALALDPYPRRPGEELPGGEGSRPSAFTALAALRKQN